MCMIKWAGPGLVYTVNCTMYCMCVPDVEVLCDKYVLIKCYYEQGGYLEVIALNCEHSSPSTH